MDKYAAEKIANYYYALGESIALGNTTKTANFGSKLVRGTVGTLGAGLGALAAPLYFDLAGAPVTHLIRDGLISLAEHGNMPDSNGLALSVIAPLSLGTGFLGAKGALGGHDALARLLSRRAP